MSLLERMQSEEFEQVVHCHDRHTGLRSIIAVHDTTLGPALGGVRMHPYASVDEALDDCLRLARGMTYKAAAAGVNLGGGKSVIIGDPLTQKSEALLRAHGRFIQTLGGRYIPGIDIGTEQADMRVIGQEARRVSCAVGDPSPMTALGVFSAIRACWEHHAGDSELAGVRVAVQGLGHVGTTLARLLHQAGASLVVSDVRRDRVAAVTAELNCAAVDPESIVAEMCEVFAPCAMGAVINDRSLTQLKAQIVAGAANNVLERPEHGEALAEAGVLYAPDFVANSGGLIFLEEEILGHDEAVARRRVESVGQAVHTVLTRAGRDGTSTHEAAERIAEERLRGLEKVGPGYVS